MVMPHSRGEGGREEWLLPYWRQTPRGPAHCKVSGRDWAGVVSSVDGGATWYPRGRITQFSARNPAVDRLIEGALVPPPPPPPTFVPAAAAAAPPAPTPASVSASASARRKLQQAAHHLDPRLDHPGRLRDHGDHRHGSHGGGGGVGGDHDGDHGGNHGGNHGGEGGGEQLLQLFRTARNVTYACTSIDRGRSWSRPFPLRDLPNPNTKLHAARLTGGQLLVAYNHHRYKLRQRSNLYVAVAILPREGPGPGPGRSPETAGARGTYFVSAHRQPRFKVLARLEGRFSEGVMFHYPQVLQVGCTVHVVYGEHGRGIRLASLQLRGEGGGS